MYLDKKEFKLPLGWGPAYPERRRTHSDTKPPVQNTDTCGEQVLTTTWLKPNESIARLKPIIAKIQKIKSDLKDPVRGIAYPLGSNTTSKGFEVSADLAKQTKLMFLDILLLLLTSHLLTVRILNASKSPETMKNFVGYENVTCDVPWDETLGMPSYPTMAADAKSLGRLYHPDDERLSALCESFSGWSLYATQKELCACNSRLKVKDLTIEIMVNHILKSVNGLLSIRQLVGLRSEDGKRLEKHYYEDKIPSRFVDSLLIISDVAATFSLEKGFLAEIWSASPPEQFKIDKFQAQIASVVGNFLKTLETKGGK